MIGEPTDVFFYMDSIVNCETCYRLAVVVAVRRDGLEGRSSLEVEEPAAAVGPPPNYLVAVRVALTATDRPPDGELQAEAIGRGRS